MLGVFGLLGGFYAFGAVDGWLNRASWLYLRFLGGGDLYSKKIAAAQPTSMRPLAVRLSMEVVCAAIFFKRKKRPRAPPAPSPPPSSFYFFVTCFLL